MTLLTNRPSNRPSLPFIVNSGVRSCATCPSAITVKEQQASIGTQIGTAVCGLKGLPLANPTASSRVQQRQVEFLAKDCKSYGTPWPGFADDAFVKPLEYSVALPNPNPPLSASVRNGTPVRNCSGCANFLPESMVKKATGFDAPLCLARGALLLVDRLHTYPKSCADALPFASAHPARVESIMLLPEYSATFGEVNVTAHVKKSREVDPTEWKTERPVTDADEERGIRAWRKLLDPTGYAPPIFMPIYRTDFHGDRAQLIPTTGRPNFPEAYIDYGGFAYKLARVWGMNATPALWGVPGVGKTELMQHMAWLMNLPFVRISINGSSELEDLIGRPQYDPVRGTWFQLGRVTDAYSKPGVLLLDEPNTGPDAVWQRIRPLTDNAKQLVLDEHDGTRVAKNHALFLGLAMNPAWDHRNVGTNQIADADARRLMHLTVYMPPENVEREIIVRQCMLTDGYDPTPHLDGLMKIAADIREAADNESINSTWAIANNVKVARLMQWFPPMEAYSIGVLNYLDPQARRLIEDAVKSYYPA